MKRFMIGFLSVMACWAFVIASPPAQGQDFENKYVDLRGSPVLAQGPCFKHAEPKVQLFCVVVEKDGVKYLITLDEQGEKEIATDERVIWVRDVI